ncbi:hypothetical protein LCGC14_0796310 [marine sediment metagenome]|uniref:Uncharacterized protein n=1 Tax=marine sediment metagenome TaxID=412755 RepID=A0A0F9QAT5_9ZZZZ
MPYIENIRRSRLDPLIDELSLGCRYPGDLAYVITKLALAQVENQGGKRFSNMATVDGILGLVQHEFRRKYVDPYEDGMCYANGDVY